MHRATNIPPSSLAEYRRKRDRSRTPEPFGERRGSSKRGAKALSFVVQKHAASHLHFDVRLELDGVLKSWAVPKGPIRVAGAPRLAVQVEDHPLDYGGFEGTIPKGEYGGGTVMVWDRGTWMSDGDPHDALRRGSLTFELQGERLKGRWRLVRRHGGSSTKKSSSGKPEWLLIKSHDEHVADDEDVREEDSRSVLTGRTMAEIADNRRPARKRTTLEAVATKKKTSTRTRSSRSPATTDRLTRTSLLALPGAKPAPEPAFTPPQLASLAKTPPSGSEWIHELKLDGYRVLITVRGTSILCLTRNGLDWTHRFPQVVAAVRDSSFPDVILDGEVVAYDDRGRPDFHRLQDALKSSSARQRSPMTFVAFDLLWCRGVDLRGLSLLERKRILSQLWPHGPSSPVRFSEHIDGATADDMIAEACRLGLEGIISKRADALYRSGRTADWIKVKCGHDGEFVICGMTASKRARTGVGALILARRSGSTWSYAGRVGAGFSEDDLRTIAQRVRTLERPTPACEDIPRGIRADVWCEPKLVAEVSYAELTADGRLRQPVFKALREDKEAKELRALDSGVRASNAPASKRRRPPARRSTPTPKPDPQPTPNPTPGPKPTSKSKSSRGAEQQESVAGVAITHPDRPIFTDPPITKVELARYYHRVASQLLTFIARRPLALLRCPQGTATIGPKTSCFVQKHFREALPEGVHRVGDADADHQLYVEDIDGIIGLVQRGVIEFHVWGCRIDDIEHPDYLVWDLDPGPGIAWDAVREAAEYLRKLCREAGLESVVRTTGGKGLHVVAYLPIRLTWPDAKALSKTLAERAAAERPNDFVVTATKSKRSKKIFIDYLRNSRGATAVSSYSVRARPGAAVAMPIGWRDLAKVESAAEFTIESLGSRIYPVAREWQAAMATTKKEPPTSRARGR